MAKDTAMTRAVWSRDQQALVRASGTNPRGIGRSLRRVRTRW
jgi:hypothetical protein